LLDFSPLKSLQKCEFYGKNKQHNNFIEAFNVIIFNQNILSLVLNYTQI
jgi:hypothetical protein